MDDSGGYHLRNGARRFAAGRNRVGARHVHIHASGGHGIVSRKADALRHLYANQRDGLRLGNRQRYDHGKQGDADYQLDRTDANRLRNRA